MRWLRTGSHPIWRRRGDRPPHRQRTAEAEERAEEGRARLLPRREAPPCIERAGAEVRIHHVKPHRGKAEPRSPRRHRLDQSAADAAAPRFGRHHDSVHQQLAGAGRPLEKRERSAAPERAEAAISRAKLRSAAADEAAPFVMETGEAEERPLFRKGGEGVSGAENAFEKALRPCAPTEDGAEFRPEGFEIESSRRGPQRLRQPFLDPEGQAAAILARIASVISVVLTFVPPVTVIRSGVL